MEDLSNVSHEEFRGSEKEWGSAAGAAGNTPLAVNNELVNRISSTQIESAHPPV